MSNTITWPARDMTRIPFAAYHEEAIFEQEREKLVVPNVYKDLVGNVFEDAAPPPEGTRPVCVCLTPQSPLCRRRSRTSP